MDGILIIDKPAGMTSHDVVDAVRRIFRMKKVGHAGTLDPMATGVLVVLLGKSTKESARLSGEFKEYTGTLVLGATSDTGDSDGKITPSGRPLDVKAADVEKVFEEFTGDILQTPPMYSAVKIGGRKMYELARKGLEVARQPRKITIKRLAVKEVNLPRVAFECLSSKGTYIRQLVTDIGQTLGCEAYLESLRRTMSGDFTLNEAVPLDRLKGMKAQELEAALVKR